MLRFLASNLSHHPWHFPHYHFPIVSPSSFTLGEAIAALGLVFTVFTIAKPTWGVAMAIKGRLKSWVVWILSGLALVSILISTLLYTPTSNTPVILNPLFWEIIGFLLFASAPFALLIIGTHTKNIFNKKNAERFYHVLLQNLSTGDDQQISVAVNIIRNNLDVLLTATKAVGSRFENKPMPKDDYRRYAYGLIETALSDTKVASYIATERIDFIWNYLEIIKDKKLKREQVGDSLYAIIDQLYQNPNSYLYRQEQYKGTGRYASVNNLIFGSSYIQSNFNPVRHWKNYNTDDTLKFNEDFVKVFLNSLETTLSSGVFKNRGMGYGEPGYVLYDLNDYARDIIYKDPSPDTYNVTKKILSKIENFYGTDFLEAYSKALKDNKVSDFEKKAEKQAKYKNQSFTTTYAYALVEFLGNLSGYDRKNDLVWHMAASATDNLIFFADNSSTDYDNIRKTFLEYMWEALKKNVEQGFYPATTRVYIPIIYLQANSQIEWIKDERKKLMDYLENTLKPKIKRKEKMNNQRDLMEEALLPKSMAYDRANDKFLWLDIDGNKSEFK